MTCPICQGDSKSLAANPFGHFLECQSCFCIYRHPNDYMSADREKARYLLHHNDLDDPGYRAYFRKFIHQAILPFRKPSQNPKVLDFGSGPQPVLSQVWQDDYQQSIKIYDPYFANDPSVLEHQYQLISCVEVVEHFQNPCQEFALLSGLLEPQGLLAIRTQFRPQSLAEFQTWWYMHDPSHNIFYSLEAMERISQAFQLSILATDRKTWISFEKLGPSQPFE